MDKTPPLSPAPSTLLEAWVDSCRQYSDKIAISDSHGSALCYKDIDAQATKLASWLTSRGIQKGDVISCQLPGWTEFLPIYIAALKLGAVFNPIGPNLRKHELRHILERCKSRALFLPRSFRHYSYCGLLEDLGSAPDQLKAIVAVDKFGEGSRFITFDAILEEPAQHPDVYPNPHPKPDELAVILFTSGSEREAKGAMFSHKNIIAAEKAFSQFFRLDHQDRIFMPAPLCHAIGFHHGINLSFLLGASVDLMDKFEAPAAIDTIAEKKPTFSMATTAFLHDLVNAQKIKNADISSLRYFLCGGSPPHLHLVAEAATLGLEVLNVYGLTESVPHLGTPPDATPAQKASQALFPMPGIQVKVVDKSGNEVAQGEEGEELSRSDAVFMGYLDMEDLTRKSLMDGWFHSGDLCRKNPDGSYTITGRIKDIIVRGGENISCLEVENILRSHPAIAEAAVIGMPDERLQEKVCAYLILKKNVPAPDLENLKAHFVENSISLHKCPERIEIRETFPKTTSGKIHKGSLCRDLANLMKSGDSN